MIIRFVRQFTAFSQLVKVQPVNQALAQHQRFIQKKFHRHPKSTNYFEHLKRTLDEYFFHFHCAQSKLNFEQKLEILERVVSLKPEAQYTEILGITQLVQSLKQDLVATQYSDEVELNISQFVNILHRIKYYDQQIWLSALDNYHKQGNLNWEQYKSFTDSLYYFQSLVTEEWQQNIIRDISQESWSDFIGFVENAEKLQLSAEELLSTYKNIRKFKLYATVDNLRTVVINYGKQQGVTQTQPQHYYEFLLTFIFDHAVQKELLPGLEKLFQRVMIDIYELFENYRALYQLIPTASNYLAMLRLASEVYFHNLLEAHLVQAWSQSMFVQFVEKRVQGLYESTENLIQMRAYVQSLHPSFFNEQQFTLMKSMIDACALENLRQLSHRKQNLIAILQYPKLMDEESQMMDYLGVIGRTKLTLEYIDINYQSVVHCTNQELIECLQELDNSELVYYITELLHSALHRIVDNVNQFDSEDWCLTYYILYKYLVKDIHPMEDEHLIGYLNVLKQYIRLHYSTNYRRAIPLQSNFYKILSVVELEAFYADDIINYY